MLRDLLAIRRDPLAYLESAVDRYGDVVAFPFPRTPVLLVNTPDGVHRVLQENHRAWSKSTAQYRALSMVTGAGLLTSDGDTWRLHRRVVQPAFHPAHLGGVPAAAAGAARRVTSVWPAHRVTVDVEPAMMRATLEVVSTCLLNGGLDAGGEQGSRVVHAVDAGLTAVISRARTPLALPIWLPTPTNRRLRRAVATLDHACHTVIDRRISAGVRPQDDDLLALLLRAAEAPGGLGYGELRDEVVTIIIAGHETVASALTWTLRLLAEHPHEQALVHAELDQDDGQLTRTRAVLAEALRLFPPAWLVTRRAEAPDMVAGVPVPAGTLVIISPWLLHRRPDDWPDPHDFIPDRFASGTPRGAYLPFGAGPRMCIGRDFALVEAAHLLATLLRHRRLSANLAPRPPVDALVTLRPRGGMPLDIHPR